MYQIKKRLGNKATVWPVDDLYADILKNEKSICQDSTQRQDSTRHKDGP